MKPTVGRKVWYRPLQGERCPGHATNDQPLDATVLKVWSDTCVNLLVLNEEGGRLPSKTSIYLAPTYEEAAPGQCGWMPYQVGQAKKTEDAEAALASAPVETKTYSDGTTVTGTAPLPDESPTAPAEPPAPPSDAPAPPPAEETTDDRPNTR